MCLPDEVWAKSKSPERLRILYIRLISELFPEPEKPTKRIVITGGMSISSFLIPPVGTQKSPELQLRSLCRSSLSPSGAIKANLSISLSTLSLGVRRDTSGMSSLSLTHSSNFADDLHQWHTILDEQYSSSSQEDSWLFISFNAIVSLAFAVAKSVYYLELCKQFHWFSMGLRCKKGKEGNKTCRACLFQSLLNQPTAHGFCTVAYGYFLALS